MVQKYYYHEHLADYAELKAKGLKPRGEIYGDSNDFDEFTICVNGEWYIHQRRYRTHENLRVELEGHGFDVLYQGGEVMENAVCVHQGSGVTL